MDLMECYPRACHCSSVSVFRADSNVRNGNTPLRVFSQRKVYQIELELKPSPTTQVIFHTAARLLTVVQPVMWEHTLNNSTSAYQPLQLAMPTQPGRISEQSEKVHTLSWLIHTTTTQKLRNMHVSEMRLLMQRRTVSILQDGPELHAPARQEHYMP